MSTKHYRSSFMLVRIQHGGLRKIIIPLPLFVLDETIKALADLMVLPDLLFPSWQQKIHQKLVGKKWYKEIQPQSSLRDIVNLFRSLFNELRQYGRWRMVEVESGKDKVYIDFY